MFLTYALISTHRFYAVCYGLQSIDIKGAFKGIAILHRSEILELLETTRYDGNFSEFVPYKMLMEVEA